MERSLVEPRGIAFDAIDFSSLRGKGIATLLLGGFRLLRAMWQSRSAIRSRRPAVVFSTGGYVAVPAGLAASTANVPLALLNADAAPLLGAFAVQTTVSLPTGSADAGRGSGSAGLNLLAISSHAFGPVAIDANVAYTRWGGDGTVVPQHNTMWTVAAGFPIAGRFGWDVEVFGYPGTSGPAGTRPVVAFLTGATVTVRPSLVLDTGAIFDIQGFGGTAVFAGVTWNIGRLWRSSRQPQLHPLPPTI
jgi:hypothetical protein